MNLWGSEKGKTKRLRPTVQHKTALTSDTPNSNLPSAWIAGVSSPHPVLYDAGNLTQGFSVCWASILPTRLYLHSLSPFYLFIFALLVPGATKHIFYHWVIPPPPPFRLLHLNRMSLLFGGQRQAQGEIRQELKTTNSHCPHFQQLDVVLHHIIKYTETIVCLFILIKSLKIRNDIISRLS